MTCVYIYIYYICIEGESTFTYYKPTLLLSSMSEKMPSNSGSDQQGTNHDNRTTSALQSLVSEIMDLCAAPSSKRHELERLLSRYMKQEGDSANSEQILLSSSQRNPENQIHATGPRSLQLQFSTNICQPVFTGVPIKGKDHPLTVKLIDAQSGEEVRFSPEASARVEIVVLEADFGGCLGENWTREEFKSKIITKEGNKRLLTGNLVLDLNEGMGCVGTIHFSHTKAWKTKRAYRLGAIAMDDSMGTKIREGFTDLFEVRDHRLDLNKKHYPPALSDEVWRLDSIARDGAFHQRLIDEEVNIKTVEDFLNALNRDPQKLRDILGKGMYAKNWEALVNHARTCIVDERLHLYSSSGSSVLFNMVGQVIGLFSEFQYVSFEMLSESQKVHAMNLVASAFQQWDKVVSFTDEASFDKYWGPSNSVYHLKLPMIESSSGINILIPPKNDEIDLPQPAISFDDKASLFDDSPCPNNIIYPPNSPTIESRTLNSPKFDNLDFPQSAVFFHDKESLFDESPSLSHIIGAPKSPIKESSSSSQILPSQQNNELVFPPPAFSFDDEASLLDEIPGPSDIICAPESFITESCCRYNILISPEIDQLGFPESVAPSQEIIPTSDSVWDMSYYNDHNLQCVDHTGHSHERHLSYSSQMTDSDNWEIIGPWLEENHDFPLQFSVDDVPLDTQGLILKSLDNPQNDENGPIVTYPTVGLVNNARKRYLRNKAKRKWRVLFSVMRWLFVCRNAAGKLPVGKLQVKLSSSYQDLQAPDSVGKDFVIPTPFETKGFQILGSHAPVFSRNLSMNSEANLHSAVNDILLARSVALATNITPRKYISKREKARRRWTKLYSVMKWFSVQRNVAKRASYALTVRGSSSYDGYVSSWDMMGPNQQNTMSLAHPFYEDEYIQLFNTFCSLEPRNRIAMNRLARRRYAVDRGFAKRKWKMLFCIMKWLSLRRNTARVKGLNKNC